MSILIDELIRAYSPVAEPTYVRVNDKQYLAKPCYGFGWYFIKRRIIDAYKVLTNKAQAYHFYEDEKNDNRKW